MAEQTVTQDGLIYTLSADGSYYSVEAENTSIVTANVLAEIDNVPVTVIGDNAFENCSELTDFTLNSVSYIEEATNVFLGCNNLTVVKFSNQGAGYIEGEQWNGKTLAYAEPVAPISDIVITVTPETLITDYHDSTDKTVTIAVDGASLSDVSVTFYPDLTEEPWVYPFFDNTTGVVSLYVSANNTVEQRTQSFLASVGDVSTQFSIVQLGIPQLELSSDSISTDYLEKTDTSISATIANAEFSDVAIECNADWVTPTIDSNGTISLAIKSNTLVDSRSATITLTLDTIVKTITVNQSGVPDIILSSDSINCNYKSITNTDVVVSVANCQLSDIDLTSTALWSYPMLDTATGILTIYISDNTTTSSRTATVTLTVDNVSKNITINQSGAPEINISGDSILVGYKQIVDDSITVSVTNATLDQVLATASVDWVIPTIDATTGTLSVTVLENTEYDSRSATITLAIDEITQTITVDQYGVVIIELNPSTLTFDYTYSEASVEYTLTNADSITLEWEDPDSSIDPWYIPSVSGNKINITATINDTIYSRQCNLLVIANKVSETLPVIQKGGPGLELSETTLIISGKTTSNDSIIVTPINCNLTAIAVTPNASWITEAIIMDTGHVSIKFEKNLENTKRIGTITFGVGYQTKTLTIIQAPRENIRIGDSDLYKVMIGQTAVSKIMLGDFIVFPTFLDRINNMVFGQTITDTNNITIKTGINSYSFSTLDIDDNGVDKIVSITCSSAPSNNLWLSQETNCANANNSSIASAIESVTGLTIDTIKQINRSFGYGQSSRRTEITISELTPNIVYNFAMIIDSVQNNTVCNIDIISGTLLKACSGLLINSTENILYESAPIMAKYGINGVVIRARSDSTGTIAFSFDKKYRVALLAMTRNKCVHAFDNSSV